jgi:hypothetical protein
MSTTPRYFLFMVWLATLVVFSVPLYIQPVSFVQSREHIELGPKRFLFGSNVQNAPRYLEKMVRERIEMEKRVGRAAAAGRTVESALGTLLAIAVRAGPRADEMHTCLLDMQSDCRDSLEIRHKIDAKSCDGCTLLALHSPVLGAEIRVENETNHLATSVDYLRHTIVARTHVTES